MIVKALYKHGLTGGAGILKYERPRPIYILRGDNHGEKGANISYLQFRNEEESSRHAACGENEERGGIRLANIGHRAVKGVDAQIPRAWGGRSD